MKKKNDILEFCIRTRANLKNFNKVIPGWGHAHEENYIWGGDGGSTRTLRSRPLWSSSRSRSLCLRRPLCYTLGKTFGVCQQRTTCRASEMWTAPLSMSCLTPSSHPIMDLGCGPSAALSKHYFCVWLPLLVSSLCCWLSQCVCEL